MVGGKAAGLAALAGLGLEIPRGFVLTRRAFDASVKAAIDLDTCRAELRIEMPAAVREEVESALRDLHGPLAVRSSATVEDSQASAFAGVYHSELNVRPEKVLDAARSCWARAFSPVAIEHALRNGVDPRGIGVALVVQEMVPADRAGVLFTVDPSGNDPDAAVLSVTRGTGERLMQGDTAGETHRLRRDERPGDPLHRELLKAALRLERKLGHPQDIEWAVSRGRIVFLQSRPISTVEQARGIVWTRALSEERFPKPISPLGWSILETVLPVNLVTLEKRFGLTARRPNDVARTIRHYVYSNERFFSIPGSLRPNPLAQARFWKGYVRECADFVRHLPEAMRRKDGVKWLGLTRLFRAFLFPHADEIRSSWDAHLSGILAEMDSFARTPLSELSFDELRLRRVRMEAVARRYMEPDLAIYVVKMAASWMVQKLGGDLAGLTAGLTENRTLGMNAELEEVFSGLDEETRTLLREERYDEIEPSGALAAFLERNGHITTNWDMREPTWGEEPAKVLRMLRSYTHGTRRRSPQESRESQQALRETAKERALAGLRGASWLASFFEQVLEVLHDFMRIDEEHHFYCSRLFRPMRRLHLELGARLAKAGALAEVDDVWFLTIPEIEEAFRNPFPRRHLVNARRAGFERSLAVRPPDRFLDQKPLDAPPAETGGTLRGVGASPGVAVGVVRVVETAEEMAALRPGEILVTPSPNPAWTPAYAVAGALVTATGSVLSHGLVSAREYRLPAVIGISDLTRRLATGQKVRVDGDRGTVQIERN